MFDIKKAIEASFNAHKDPNRRLHLMRFLMRAANGTGLVTQWRSVGRDYEIVDEFLRTSGLTETDYQIHVSTLDPNVHDFRWVTGSTKYLELINQVQNQKYREKFGEIVGMIFLDNQRDVTEVYGVGETTDVTADGDASAPAFDIVAKTKARIAQFIEKVRQDPNPPSELVTVVDALENDNAAIPNLAFIELIDIYLGLINGERIFDAGKSTLNCQKTVLRHITNGVQCPRNMLLASTVPSFEYAIEQRHALAKDRPVGVISSFFYRTREQASKVIDDSAPILVSAFEPIKVGEEATTLVQASNSLPNFWSNIGALYSAFFDCHVIVTGASRIGIAPDNEVWASRTNLDHSQTLEAFRDLGFVDDDNPSAVGVMANVVLLNQPIDSKPAVRTVGSKHVYFNNDPVASQKFKFADAAQNTEDLQFDSAITLTDDELPTEWYSLVHHNGRDIQNVEDQPDYWGCYRGYGDLAVLAKYKSKAATGIPRDVTLIRAINPETNQQMQIEFVSESSAHILNKNPVSSMVAGLSAALRSKPDATYAAWPFTDDRFYAAHGRTTVVSAVYSLMAGDDTFHSKLIQSPDEESFTNLVKELPRHQHDKVVNGDGSRAIVIETNLVEDATFAQTRLKGIVGGVIFGNLVLRNCIPELGVVSTTPEVHSVLDIQCVRSRYRVKKAYNEACNSSSPSSAGDPPIRSWSDLMCALGDDTVAPIDWTDRNNDGIHAWDLSRPSEWDSWGNPHINIRFRNDTAGRLYIIATLDSVTALSALVQYRIARKLPWFDARMAARLRCYDPSIAEIDADHDAPAALDETVRSLLNYQQATDFGTLSCHDRFYGFGPWFKNKRPNQYGPMTQNQCRASFAVPDPSSYVSNARANPLYRGLVRW